LLQSRYCRETASGWNDTACGFARARRARRACVARKGSWGCVHRATASCRTGSRNPIVAEACGV